MTIQICSNNDTITFWGRNGFTEGVYLGGGGTPYKASLVVCIQIFLTTKLGWDHNWRLNICIGVCSKYLFNHRCIAKVQVFSNNDIQGQV